MVNGVDSLLGAASQQSPLSPTSLQPTITSTAPTLSVSGATGGTAAKNLGVPQFNENPLGAIGAVLLDVSRGMRGQPLHTQQLARQGLQMRQAELQRLSFGLDAATKGLTLMQELPAEQQVAFAEKFGAQFESAIPGFTELFQGAAKDPEAAMEELEAFGDLKEEFWTLGGGTLRGARKAASDPAKWKLAREMQDNRNTPEIFSAFQGLGKRIAELPPEQRQQVQDFMAQAKERGFTVADLRNNTFMTALGLTTSHVNTIARSPELQSQLSQFGLIPQKAIDLKMQETIKAAAKPPKLTRIEDEAGGKKVHRFVDDDGRTRFSIPTNVDATSVRDVSSSDIRAATAMRLAGFDAKKSGLPQGAIDVTEGKSEQELVELASMLDSGQKITIDKDGKVTIQSSSGLTAKRDLVEKLEQQEASTLKLMNLGTRISEIIGTVGDVTTAAGTLSQFGGNLMADVLGTMKLIGFQPEKNLNLPSDHPDKLTTLDPADAESGKVDHLFPDELKSASAQVKGMLFRFAVSAAAAINGQKGRGLSDFDVQQEIRAIGGNLSDPEQLQATVNETMRNAYENLRIDHLIATRNPETGESISFPSFEEFQSRAMGRANGTEPKEPDAIDQTINDLRGKTQEEQEAILNNLSDEEYNKVQQRLLGK